MTSLIVTKEQSQPQQQHQKHEQQLISHCTKIGENGEQVMVAVTTEESHEATVSGKHIVFLINK